LLSDGYSATESLLKEHADKLREVAERLVVDEKMDGDAFRAIMEGSAPAQDAESAEAE
jgi:ATP-dependent Zn protease